jgi:hypothetical protein
MQSIVHKVDEVLLPDLAALAAGYSEDYSD